MEDQATYSLRGPHWRPRLADGTTPEFTPLRLTVEGGELTLLVDRPEMIAGRHSDADLRLPLPDVSRRHCRFAWNAGHWQVFDLGSLNGLYVNDQLIQFATLEQGDRLRIGGFAFVVHVTSETTIKQDERSLYSVFASLPRPAEQPPRRLAS
jgi:pSer/pThr/pTyr-binding forkhead associated (FHA) protein